MGWSLGYDNEWKRDIGYGVPALCDKPGCLTTIDRGLGHVCGGEAHLEDDRGCGLFFCAKHLYLTKRGQVCNRCFYYKPPYKRIKPDVLDWVLWKARDLSWLTWRRENPKQAQALEERIAASDQDIVANILVRLQPTPESEEILEGELVE